MRKQVKILLYFLLPFLIINLFISFPRVIEKNGDLKFISITTLFLNPYSYTFLVNKYGIPILSWKNMDSFSSRTYPLFVFKENNTYTIYIENFNPYCDPMCGLTKYVIQSSKVKSNRIISHGVMNNEVYRYYLKELNGEWFSHTGDTLLIDSTKVKIKSLLIPLQLFPINMDVERYFGENADKTMHDFGIDLNMNNNAYSKKYFKKIIELDEDKLILQNENEEGYIIDQITYVRIRDFDRK